jgi:hypothetical protein
MSNRTGGSSAREISSSRPRSPAVEGKRDYILWDRSRPGCDKRESGDSEAVVVKLVTQHLSAATLSGKELDPWAETSPQRLSELMGRKWSEVRTSFLEQVSESGGDVSQAVRKVPSPVMASKVSISETMKQIYYNSYPDNY